MYDDEIRLKQRLIVVISHNVERFVLIELSDAIIIWGLI